MTKRTTVALWKLEGTTLNTRQQIVRHGWRKASRPSWFGCRHDDPPTNRYGAQYQSLFVESRIDVHQNGIGAVRGDAVGTLTIEAVLHGPRHRKWHYLSANIRRVMSVRGIADLEAFTAPFGECHFVARIDACHEANER